MNGINRSLLVALLGGVLGLSSLSAVSLAATGGEANGPAASLADPADALALAVHNDGVAAARGHNGEDENSEDDDEDRPAHPGKGSVFRAARAYLDVSQREIERALHDGMSLAELAVAKGKTRAGLIEAVLATLDPRADPAEARATIERIVDAKRLPKGEELRDLARLAEVLERLVSNGTITRAQAQAILDAFATPRPAPSEVRFSGEVLRAAREYLGLGEKELQSVLRSGKSLAELALANGKTRDGLIQAILQAVLKAQPTIDQARATSAIAKIVDQRFPLNAGRDRGRGSSEGKGKGHRD